MKSKTPIIEELLRYKEEKNLILSMPGNKSGIGFLRDDIGREFINNLGFLDITEVEPLDNLHNPEGIIKESQQLLAKTYGVEKAYFLVNGSTSGNLASIFSAFKEGDEVLVERNCHKSIYNGLILRKLKPTYIEASIDLNNEILLPCTEKDILDSIRKANNPKGIILTSPNYYGVSVDLTEILKELKKRGLKIIIDAAHGAHYGFSEKLPKAIANTADYIITSAHKTLPSLTQGAYLLVNDKESDVQFYINAFNTTSPSYLLMASLEYGRYYLDEYGQADYSNLIDMAEEFREKINTLNKVKILCDEDINKIYDSNKKPNYIDIDKDKKNKYILDKSRYIVTVPTGYSGSKLLDYLRSKKIQCEMSFSKGVVLLLSPFNTREDFNKIVDSIKELDINSIVDSIKDIDSNNSDINNKAVNSVDINSGVINSVDINSGVIKEDSINNIQVNNMGAYYKKVQYKNFNRTKVLEPYEVFDMSFKEVKLEQCLGKISKDFITPYPPGIPLVLPGEEISEEVLSLINEYKKNNISILGINNGMVKIVCTCGVDT